MNKLLLFNIIPLLLLKEIKPDNETKGIQTGKKELKLFLHAYDMTLYILNNMYMQAYTCINIHANKLKQSH